MRKHLGFGVSGIQILPIVCDEHPIDPGPLNQEYFFSCCDLQNQFFFPRKNKPAPLLPSVARCGCRQLSCPCACAAAPPALRPPISCLVSKGRNIQAMPPEEASWALLGPIRIHHPQNKRGIAQNKAEAAHPELFHSWT